MDDQRRHCEERSDEAIHPQTSQYLGMDCFASLEMTGLASREVGRNA